MSFPIIHSMVGYSVYRVGKGRKKSWEKVLFFALLASAADLDYIPGVLIGNPNLFHHTITHSIAAAIVCGFVIAVLAKLFTVKEYPAPLRRRTHPSFGGGALGVSLQSIHPAFGGMNVVYPPQNVGGSNSLCKLRPATLQAHLTG